MANFSSRKRLTTIKMRAAQEFKSRFDEACMFRGWTVQTALTRVLGEWVEHVEKEIEEKKIQGSTVNARSGYAGQTHSKAH